MKKFMKITSLLLAMTLSLCTLFACDSSTASTDNSSSTSEKKGQISQVTKIEGSYVEAETSDLATQITKIVNSDQMKLIMQSIDGNIAEDVCAAISSSNKTSVKLEDDVVLSAEASSLLKLLIAKGNWSLEDNIMTNLAASKLYTEAESAINIDKVLLETISGFLGDVVPSAVMEKFVKDYEFTLKTTEYFDGENIYSSIDIDGVEALIDELVATAKDLGSMTTTDIAEMEKAVEMIKKMLSCKYVDSLETLLASLVRATPTSGISFGTSEIVPTSNETDGNSLTITENDLSEYILVLNAYGIEYKVDLSNNDFKLKLNTTNTTISALKAMITEYIDELNGSITKCEAQVKHYQDLIDNDPEMSADRVETYNEYISDYNDVIEEAQFTISIWETIDIDKFAVEVYLHADKDGNILAVVANYDIDVNAKVPTTADGQVVSIATNGSISFDFSEIVATDFEPADFDATMYEANPIYDWMKEQVA